MQVVSWASACLLRRMHTMPGDPERTCLQVVAAITKCGENSSEAVQLAVIRALLTITTAEHFVVHGDSLMQSVCPCCLHVSSLHAVCSLAALVTC